METLREITAERLREVLEYDPGTGIFRWREQRGRCRAGERAGHAKKSGYRYIRVDGVKYLEHRLAWLYVHGKWPAIILDHIDRNPGNNRISNLRDVTFSVNSQNCGKVMASAGEVRQRRPGGRWSARHSVNGKWQHVGTFDTEDEARLALSAQLGAR